MSFPAWERRFVAAALSALVVVPVLVALGAGASRTSPVPFVLAGAAVLAALALAAKAGRGPLAWFAARLPPEWDQAFRRRPRLAIAWGVLALVGVVQITRLSCFMADANLSWGSAFPPVREGVTHACLSAYVHAADLQRRGDVNVYAESHYPAFQGGTLGHAPPMSSPVRNLSPWLEDPFEYPPPFLLWPRAALALTNDFLVIRAVWFGLKVALFWSCALVMAAALGGARGRMALLLTPALFASLPFMFDLQFGQFHLVSICLAALGMHALDRDKPGWRLATGAALLGAATVSKLFPGLLLVYLAARGRWRSVLATAAACALLTGLALAILGPAPFRAFLDYQLPRIASGEAFSFFRRSDLTIAANWGIYGIPVKLARLGLPGMTPAVSVALSWIYTVPLVAIAVLAGRRAAGLSAPPLVGRERSDPREPREPSEPTRPLFGAGLAWLALLSLASLRSPLAPNVYVGAPALWLLAGCAVDTRGRPGAVAAVVLAWLAMGGLPPLWSPEATIVGWMTGQATMLALGFWVLLRRRSTASG